MAKKRTNLTSSKKLTATEMAELDQIIKEIKTAEDKELKKAKKEVKKADKIEKKVIGETKKQAKKSYKTIKNRIEDRVAKEKKTVKKEVKKIQKKAKQEEKSQKLLWLEATRPQRKQIRRDRWTWFWLGICFFGCAVLIEAAIYLTQDILPELPDVDQLVQQQQRATTKIYDRNHHLLYSVFVDENRTPVKLAEVSGYMKQATLAIEDSDFYAHHGFSISGIVRAARNNFLGEKLQGGSTITQQLVKNRLLSRERTMDRKVKELILSLIVEGTYNKDDILEMYLNDVSYGGTVYGVEQAAVSYFGKNAKNLSLGESAYLAGITTAPSVYSPYAGNIEAALVRRDEVFRRMIEEGYVTAEQVAEAKNEELKFMPGSTTMYAPHFVFYVKDYLVQMYGEDVVNSGGLEVTTTLDLPVQNEAQEVLSAELNDLKRLNISNGAILMTNPQTGEVLTMLGSKNYWDYQHDGQVNVTLAQRQPGSSIKPLTYTLALLNGQTPASVIEDVPFNYVDPWSKKVYSPKNYDGKFHGRVTLRESLGSSYNIPAVKTLYQYGVNSLVDLGEKMGITTWTERQRYGLSLALGAGEVKMTDMAVAYGEMANGGYKVPLNPILEVRNAKGEVIYQNDCALKGVNCPDEQVIPAEIAYQITSILSDNQARTPAFGPQSVLNIPGQEVAVKTGTTNNLRDNWTIGYTSDRLVAVWVGNNDNKPMSYVASGITGASPIWQKTMKLTLDPEKPHTFKVPSGVVAVDVCKGSTQPKCNTGCQGKLEYFAPKYQAVINCSDGSPAPRIAFDESNLQPEDDSLKIDLASLATSAALIATDQEYQLTDEENEYLSELNSGTGLGLFPGITAVMPPVKAETLNH